jgi:serine/threonine-protein kinase
VPNPTGSDPTFGSDADVTRPATTPFAASKTPSTSRFAPGAIIAGRYRLVALLGRGGMGEVYRADDLTLDQPVALKFLAAGVAADEARLAQFHNELRVARQVSHKNVCRLYDLGDADGRRFLTMEYVDGEDLGALLRRIGRFPQDKAIDIARQLCAGVAAAHERGVLHRDLKPANVMLDGDGNVRITDFGIATAGASADGGDSAYAGTPQYMAPEQLAGRPASIKSDIYALGLVLFEIFTGRRAYDAKTLGDLKQLHDTGTVTTPSSIVRDLDPAVERVILRCLSKNADERPASALSVAVALPGGNPLAAALSAGETPSPDMLAAAGEAEALSVWRGLAAVAFVIVGIGIMAALSSRASIAGLVPLDKPPAVLADRAQQIAASLGYTEPWTDAADGFSIAPEYLRWVVANDQSPHRWDVLKSGSPPVVLFWSRTSPRLLATERIQSVVTPSDPPLIIVGMTLVLLDTRGLLREFHAVPPQFDPDPAADVTPHWAPLFEAAGLPLAAFTPDTPEWTPTTFADTRAAWHGPLPDRPELTVRVEAAAYRGRPVSFLIIGPWTRASRMVAPPRTASQTALQTFVILVAIALFCAALLLARHNLKANRADRRGAARLAAFVMLGYAATWVIGGHHMPDVSIEVTSFMKVAANILLAAGLMLLTYLALEPYVRRFWPDGVLGWTRLMSGHVRDPRVGRDVLIGCVAAVGLMLVEMAHQVLPPLIGYPTAIPEFGSDVRVLIGVSTLISRLFEVTANGLFTAMLAVLCFVVLRLIVRRTPLAIAVAALLLGLVQAQDLLTSGTPIWIGAIFLAGGVAIIVTLVVRYGLLVTAVALAVADTLDGVPLTAAASHWSGTTSNLTIAVVLALTLFGFYASRAGQPLFGKIADGM